MYEFYISPEEYEEAEKNGISNKTLEQRIRHLGWKKQRALTEAPRVTQDRSEWVKIARENGINYNTFMGRINRYKYSLERAATEPINDTMENMRKGARMRKKYPDEILELVKKNGIKYNTFLKRVRSGMEILEAATMPTKTRQELGQLGWAARGKNGYR